MAATYVGWVLITLNWSRKESKNIWNLNSSTFGLAYKIK
jgi:hypothetical protein